VLTTLALGKEKSFFENLFAECPSAWHSAKKKVFLKNSLPSACFPGTRKSWETGQSWFRFLALPSVFGIALSKVTITDPFF
jgi:hypothetical protein